MSKGLCIRNKELVDAADECGSRSWAAKQLKSLCNGEGLLPVLDRAPCPVKAWCLELAMTAEHGMGIDMRWGVYGGLDARERLRLAQERGCSNCGEAPIGQPSRTSPLCRDCRQRVSGGRVAPREEDAA